MEKKSSTFWDFLGDSVVKNLPANAGDIGVIFALGRFPGERNDNPLQYSSLGNPMGRGALEGYSPWGLKESDTTYQLNNNNKAISDGQIVD